MNIKIINATLFTGDSILESGTIGIKDGKFCDAGSSLPDEIIDLENDWLVPGFIDLQLYGGNGELFSDKLSVESLRATYDYSIAGGATSILPTIATNSEAIIFKAIDVIKAYQQQKRPGILGLHLEGPFINPLKRGAHLEKYIQQPTLDLAKKIIDKAEGVIKIITLAPECCDEKIISYFIDNGIILSAGHSNATIQEANNGFERGIQLVTHLFNAMSPLNHREPGLPAAAMLNENVSASIVADGYHVNFEMIRLAKKIMSERLFLITDAVTGSGGVYPHQLSGDRYILPDGTLSGSALTMMKAVQNCIEKVGISKVEAFRMASLYPAKALHIDDQYGKIENGYVADFLRVDDHLQIKEVFKNGLRG
ncbi:MAG: N-acetylglucosamine-6-phosphate deacetylase [Ferruginibacter sp.]